MNFKLTIEFRPEYIAEVIKAGMPHVKSWGDISEEKCQTTAHSNVPPGWAHDYIGHAVSGGRLAISVRDQQFVYYLTKPSIALAITRMAASHKKHFAALHCGDYDAETGDILVQLALFGEVTYG